VQELQNRASEGRSNFRLRDLLTVPMQRVLKYHLLLKVCHSLMHYRVHIALYRNPSDSYKTLLAMCDGTRHLTQVNVPCLITVRQAGT